MLPKNYTERGCILFATINDLITYIARDYPLKNFEVVVISKSIITESRGKEQRNFGNQIVDESKYDNVDFIPNLIPTTSTLSLLYSGKKGGSGYEDFSNAYLTQLGEDEVFNGLICLVDMAFTDHIPILVLAVDVDFNMGYPDILMGYIHEMFGYKCYTTKDFLDPECDICDVGDRAQIEELLKEYKIQFGEQNDVDAFYNFMTESIRVKYKSLLDKKTTEQLVQIATDAGIFIRKRDTKDDIIRKIIDAKAKRR